VAHCEHEELFVQVTQFDIQAVQIDEELRKKPETHEMHEVELQVEQLSGHITGC